MLTHYLKIAFRNLWKNRAQSLTAILGLAFAVACLIPALYWMRYETSYDHFYPQAENIGESKLRYIQSFGAETARPFPGD